MDFLLAFARTYTGVLHFSLSQVSHFLVYYAVNDSVIAVLLFSLTL